MVNAVLEMSALLFQHLGGIPHTMWKKINWSEGRREVPATKTKMDLDHIVPLSG